MVKLRKEKIDSSRDFLTPLVQDLPASWALIRANEIKALQGTKFLNPSLDIGCGDGLVAKVLLRGTKFDWGIDMSEIEIAKAKKSGAYKNCKVASVYDLPFKNGEFKTVFSNSVIEHLKKLDISLAEISRVLEKGGKLIITVPTPYLTEYLGGRIFFGDLYGIFFNKVFKHYNLYTHSQWKYIFKKHNLLLTSFKYYHSKKIIRSHEVLSYLAVIERLFPFIHKMLLPIFIKKLKPLLSEETLKNGGSCMLIAVKD